MAEEEFRGVCREVLPAVGTWPCREVRDRSIFATQAPGHYGQPQQLPARRPGGLCFSMLTNRGSDVSDVSGCFLLFTMMFMGALCLWMFMGVLRMFMDVLRIFMDVLRMFMDVLRILWMFYGCSWIFLDIYVCLWMLVVNGLW